MREIKFRAWDKTSKIMVDVINLDLQGGNFITTMITPGKPTEQWTNTNDMLELMQYTGLKDKNGKEIYEGDVLKQGEKLAPCYVDFYLNKAQYRLARKNLWAGLAFTEKSTAKIEVIGNLYENPELLK